MDLFAARPLADALDPATIGAAAAGHFTFASRIGDGMTVVSCGKLVEEQARAMVLVVPGVLRVDVRPVDDAVQVLTRKLRDRHLPFGTDISGQPGWRARDTEAPPTSDGAQRMDFRVFAQLEDYSVLADILLLFATESRTRATYVSTTARLREIDPSSVTLT